MSSDAPARALSVSFQGRILRVELTDGRTIRVPLSHSPRLADATPAQREHFELLGAGEGLHWPQLDEDLNVEQLLRTSIEGS